METLQHQLKLTKKQLKHIGFKKTSFINEDGKRIETFRLKGKVNDEIYYNPKESKYVWYYKTIIGENANHINLDISHEVNLFMVLQVFGFKYNF